MLSIQFKYKFISDIMQQIIKRHSLLSILNITIIPTLMTFLLDMLACLDHQENNSSTLCLFKLKVLSEDKTQRTNL